MRIRLVEDAFRLQEADCLRPPVFPFRLDVGDLPAGGMNGHTLDARHVPEQRVRGKAPLVAVELVHVLLGGYHQQRRVRHGGEVVPAGVRQVKRGHARQGRVRRRPVAQFIGPQLVAAQRPQDLSLRIPHDPVRPGHLVRADRLRRAVQIEHHQAVPLLGAGARHDRPPGRQQLRRMCVRDNRVEQDVPRFPLGQRHAAGGGGDEDPAAPDGLAFVRRLEKLPRMGGKIRSVLCLPAPDLRGRLPVLAFQVQNENLVPPADDKFIRLCFTSLKCCELMRSGHWFCRAVRPRATRGGRYGRASGTAHGRPRGWPARRRLRR